MWTILPSSAVRPTRLSRPGVIGCALKKSSYSREKPAQAARRKLPSCWRKIWALSTSHRRAAEASSVSSTLRRSNADRLMTLRTSAVAACSSTASARCFRASPRSWVRALSSFSRSVARALRVLISAAWDAPDAATRVPAFVPVERSLRPCVRLFAPLRDKVTPAAPRSAQALLAADL